MIKDALRLVAVILLIIIIIMDDFPFYEKMKDSSTQLFLGVLVVAFIFYDTVFGFIMGLVVMLIYFEIYKKIIAKQELIQDINSNQILPPGIQALPGMYQEPGIQALPGMYQEPGIHQVSGIFMPEDSSSDVIASYTEVYKMNMQPSVKPTIIPPASSSECPLKMDYISEAHLLAAQNNIFDIQNYQSEFKGLEKGFNNEKVYGVQGLNSDKVNHKGYSKTENIYTLLSDGK
jgi:hypothetical protein